MTMVTPMDKERRHTGGKGKGFGKLSGLPSWCVRVREAVLVECRYSTRNSTIISWSGITD